ncbi:DNA-directed RNA polymerase III subunit RPC4 [Frankliniella fusca]|uniref:DNA-directed RNA polymerase III subunit RPC4 n=1 Tax=Frankliniella fusca TaxID=407009 RepID=A0AAE1H5T0_9NEOP|nr:DNA-directed RNA polymerase III subunit RPC4 [Frankliniella fusca]
MPEEKEQKPIKQAATSIKTEGSSRSSNSIVRLPSFRQPRDLTLGSGGVGRAGALGLGVNKARKNYAPNLNVQRNKAKEDVKVKEDPSKSRSERGRGRGERGKGERGRGRGAPNVIQLSSGVFSEGIAAGRRPTRGRQEDNNSSYVPKPKLDLKQNYTADSKEENERLRQLLQDDFVDDPDAAAHGLKPLQLPMIPMKKKGAQRSRGAIVKKENEDPDLITDNSEIASDIKIKKEPGGEEETDFKPLSEDEGHIVFERRVGDLLGSKKPEYILVQLPDCLPGLRPSVEPEAAKSVNGTPSSGSVSASQNPQCTLSTIPEGCIGKIQIMRSGLAHLKLGSVSMPITMGTQVGFKQDLISVNLDDCEKTGKMINLGQIRARVVVTPDWETLLSRA